jgi:hypothetical protein
MNDNQSNMRHVKKGVSAIKRRKYLKDKLNELARNSRKEHRQLYRGITAFFRCYQPQIMQ